MSLMFRTNTHDNHIDAHEIVARTASSVTYIRLGVKVREKIKTDWHEWHPTWEEAKACLVLRAINEVKAARLILSRAQGTLGNVRGMKRPAELA